MKPLDELSKESLNSFRKGNVVIAFDEVENAYSRYIYIEPDLKSKRAMLYNIDSPKEVQNVAFSKILPADPEAYSHPSLGFQFNAIGKITPGIDQQIRQLALKESFEAKILYVKHFKDGRLKNIAAALLNSDKRPIMKYKISPYFMSTKMVKFLKIETSCMASSLKSVKISVKEKVHGLWDTTINFGQWSDYLLVLRIQDVKRRSELQQILQKACANAPPIITNIDMSIQTMLGQLVACKFSRDGQYYRAVVTGVKPDKVRLNFVDYGNLEGIIFKLQSSISLDIVEFIKTSWGKHLN